MLTSLTDINQYLSQSLTAGANQEKHKVKGGNYTQQHKKKFNKIS